jgi:hypothetical protein
MRMSSPHSSLEEIGLRIGQAQLSYHIFRLPSALMLPKETFERNLIREGCRVSQVPMCSNQDSSGDNIDHCWNYFSSPATPDGRKLDGIVCKFNEMCTDSGRQQPRSPESAHFRIRPPSVQSWGYTASKEPVSIRFEGSTPRSAKLMEMAGGAIIQQPWPLPDSPNKVRMKWRFDPRCAGYRGT